MDAKHIDVELLLPLLQALRLLPGVRPKITRAQLGKQSSTLRTTAMGKSKLAGLTSASRRSNSYSFQTLGVPPEYRPPARRYCFVCTKPARLTPSLTRAESKT